MSTNHFLSPLTLHPQPSHASPRGINTPISKSTIPARVAFIAAIAGLLLVAAVNVAWADVMVSDPHGNGSFLGLPDLALGGPIANTHRAVLYNHGGMGSQEGGDLSKTVEMLAEEGFIAYAKKRSGMSISATLEEVKIGLDELLDMTPDMLQGRSIASSVTGPGTSVIGYSRGGLMALRIAELQNTLTKTSVKIDKVIIQAAAPGEDLSNPGNSGQWIEGGQARSRTP